MDEAPLNRELSGRSEPRDLLGVLIKDGDSHKPEMVAERTPYCESISCMVGCHPALLSLMLTIAPRL
jgi:hypothetical protein